MSTTEYDREVCTMRSAETVLNVIRERGERGLPLGAFIAYCTTGTYTCGPTVVSTQTRER